MFSVERRKDKQFLYLVSVADERKGERLLDKEQKLQMLDFAIVIGLFFAGCFIGKLAMHRYDTWISFNCLALGVLMIGELNWWRFRKKQVKKWKEDKQCTKNILNEQ